jgi:hypothetical protein
MLARIANFDAFLFTVGRDGDFRQSQS